MQVSLAPGHWTPRPADGGQIAPGCGISYWTSLPRLTQPPLASATRQRRRRYKRKDYGTNGSRKGDTDKKLPVYKRRRPVDGHRHDTAPSAGAVIGREISDEGVGWGGGRDSGGSYLHAVHGVPVRMQG